LFCPPNNKLQSFSVEICDSNFSHPPPWLLYERNPKTLSRANRYAIAPQIYIRGRRRRWGCYRGNSGYALLHSKGGEERVAMPPVVCRLKERGYDDKRAATFCEADIAKAADEYKAMLADMTAKRDEARNAKKPFYIFIGTNHTSGQALFYELLLVRAAKSLGLNAFFGEANQENYELTTSIVAGKSSVPAQASAEMLGIDAAEQLGMTTTPVDTYLTGQMIRDMQRKIYLDAMISMKRDQQIGVKLSGGKLQFFQSCQPLMAMLVPGATHDYKLLVAQNFITEIEKISPQREAAMLASIQESKESGMISSGAHHAKTLVSALGENAVVYAVNANDIVVEKQLLDSLKGSAYEAIDQWIQNPANMVQKTENWRGMTPQSAYALSQIVSERLQMTMLKPEKRGR
jgi:hypothetical protein